MNVRNRKCIRKLSFRTLWASWKRNLIAVLAIVLTTLLFTSLFTIALSINRTYEMYTFRQIGGYPHGSYKQVTDEEITAIASHRNIQAVGERTNIGYIGTGVFAKVPAEVSFMDKNCTQWSFASPIEGHIPLSGKEVTMDTNALALLGIEPQIGAEVTLTFTVGDQYQYAYDKTDTFTLVGWWEYDNIMPVHYINISEEYADLVEAEGKSNGLQDFRTDLNVMLRSEINIEPHKLCNAIDAYGLAGKVVNSHRAIDDVLATVAVMEAMVAERDDLECYVNLFGYNPKYGIDGKPIGSVTYKPQPYRNQNQQFITPLYATL